jgi:IS30 family transposase
VCRQSRIIFADLLLQQKESSLAIALSVSLFKMMKDQPHVHSFTNDNGTEFVDYEYLDEQLRTKTFFADPYSSRQR